MRRHSPQERQRREQTLDIRVEKIDEKLRPTPLSSGLPPIRAPHWSKSFCVPEVQGDGWGSDEEWDPEPEREPRPPVAPKPRDGRPRKLGRNLNSLATSQLLVARTPDRLRLDNLDRVLRAEKARAEAEAAAREAEREAELQRRVAKSRAERLDGLAADVRAAEREKRVALEALELARARAAELESLATEMETRAALETVQRREAEVELRLARLRPAAAPAGPQQDDDLDRLDWPHDHARMVAVSNGSSEWAQVAALVAETMPEARVSAVARVENRWLWEAFQFTARRLQRKTGADDGVLQLFHGTRGLPPSAICLSSTGFDTRMAGTSGYYGQGIYFSEAFRYSHDYAHATAGGRQVVLALVAVGHSLDKGAAKDQTLRRPPEMPVPPPLAPQLEKTLYDSVTGTPAGVARMHVVYENAQAYPQYLVTYR